MEKSNKKQQKTQIQTHAKQEWPEIGEKVERSKYVYELVNGWIENADNKVSVSCGVFTVAFGIITFLADRFVATSDTVVIDTDWNCVYRISFILSIIAMVIGIYFYARSIIPNLKSCGEQKTNKDFPIFYRDISLLSDEEYLKLMEKATDEDFFEELVRETRMNSKICTNKMYRYKLGVILSIIALCLAILSFFVRYLMCQ